MPSHRMVAKFYGKNYTLQALRARAFITKSGVSMLGISDAAESIGFSTFQFRSTLFNLPLPTPPPVGLNSDNVLSPPGLALTEASEGFRGKNPTKDLVKKILFYQKKF